jgi:spoIIIJ-associated protein
MGIESQVEPYYVDAADDNEIGPLVLQISGRDLGALIGRRGDTLAALQYITRLIVSRDIQRRANLVVDVERYKSRRERRLRSLALRMAKQATQRGRTVTLEPMAAYERRIIHLTLRDRTDVYTQSIGEGDNRKVTIVPVRDR